MKSEDNDYMTFVAFGLDPEKSWPHEAGDIPIRLLKKEDEDYAPGEIRVIWGIRAGTSYLPEEKSQEMTLEILKGSGVISIDGRRRHYREHERLTIPAGALRGFVAVLATTIVLQSQRGTSPHRGF